MDDTKKADFGRNKPAVQNHDTIVQRSAEKNSDYFNGASLGVDFGTTKTTVSYYVNLTNCGISRALGPVYSTAVFYITKSNFIIGRDAETRGRINPEALVVNFKKDLGTGKKYHIKPLEEDDEIVLKAETVTKDFLSEIISASNKMLTKMHSSELRNNDVIKNIIFTIPAFYKDMPQKKKAMKNAVKTAVPECDFGMITEPNAIAVAYNEYKGSNSVLVYDFGGGTFDLCLLKKNISGLENVAEDGIADLGGVNITGKIFADAMRKLDEWLRKKGYDVRYPVNRNDFDTAECKLVVSDYNEVYYTIYDFCEDMKISLSGEQAVLSREIRVITGYGDRVMTDRFVPAYTVKELKAIIDEDITRTVKKTFEFIDECAVKYADNCIDQIFLAGGSSMLPGIEEKFREELMKRPEENIQIIKSNPITDNISTLVSDGAAVVAAQNSGSFFINADLCELGYKGIMSGVSGAFIPLVTEKNIPCTFEKTERLNGFGNIVYYFYKKDRNIKNDVVSVGSDMCEYFFSAKISLGELKNFFSIEEMMLKGIELKIKFGYKISSSSFLSFDDKAVVTANNQEYSVPLTIQE